jgi:hypothetical protein
MRIYCGYIGGIFLLKDDAASFAYSWLRCDKLLTIYNHWEICATDSK